MSIEVIDFEQLKLDSVINQSALTKSITFLGTYKEQDVVVRLEKTPFEEISTKQALSSQQLVAKRNLINDIYSRYMLAPWSSSSPTSEVNHLKAIIICPADKTVINKYSRSPAIFFSETSEVYAKIIEPFLVEFLNRDINYNQWVYNILDGKTETEHVLFNDTNKDSGFVLLPSLKSSGDNKELHVLAICHRRDIRSLRDLNETHLPLLKNILEHGPRVIGEKYNIDYMTQLRSYVHYHPTFYHFHVHFELIDASEYKSSDRDHLLISIISNISLRGDYYTKATLSYPLAETSELHPLLCREKIIKLNRDNNISTKLDQTN